MPSSLLNGSITNSAIIKNPATNTGVTLIELMVALAISTVLMLGIGSIFFSTKRGYQISDEFAQLQENGRYAMELVQQAVRDAGNLGCGSGFIGSIDSALDVAGAGSSFIYDFSTGIVGFEYTAGNTSPGNAPFAIAANPSNGAAGDWTGPPAGQTTTSSSGNNIPVTYTLPANIAALAVPGSDILVTRSIVSSGVNVEANNDAANLWATDTGTSNRSCPPLNGNGPSSAAISDICPGDILLVSDCTKSLVFQATNTSTPGNGPGACQTTNCMLIVHAASGTPGNAPPAAWGAVGGAASANRQYGPGSEILRVESKLFFVGVGADGNPSLYLSINNGAPVPIVDGVENMQVLYGVDTDDDGIPNQYYTADQVEGAPGDKGTDQTFENVVSTRIAMIVRTPNPMPGVDKTAALAGNASILDVSMISSSANSAITIQPANDSRLRKVFDLTVELRNRASNIGI